MAELVKGGIIMAENEKNQEKIKEVKQEEPKKEEQKKENETKTAE